MTPVQILSFGNRATAQRTGFVVPGHDAQIFIPVSLDLETPSADRLVLHFGISFSQELERRGCCLPHVALLFRNLTRIDRRLCLRFQPGRI